MTAMQAPSTMQWAKSETSLAASSIEGAVETTETREEPGADVFEDSRESMDDDFLPIQQHSRPATPDEVAFERDVLILSNGRTEDELNKHYKLVAQDLGLERRSKGSVNDSDVPDTTLTVTSSVRNSLSQASQSTPPTSCDSSERQTYQAYNPATGTASKPHLLLNIPDRASNASRFGSRPPSVLSSRSIGSSIKSGWRRLSSLSKKRTSTIPATESTPSVFSLAPDRTPDCTPDPDARNSITTSRPTTGRRPSTSNSTVTAKTCQSRPPSVAHSFTSYHDNIPPILSPRDSTLSARNSRPPSLSRGKSLPSITSASSASVKNFSVPFSPTLAPRSKSSDTRIVHGTHARPLSPTREEDYSHAAELKAAQARTARNRDLQRLRASHLAEQGRFLAFQADQAARISSKHHDRVRAHRKLWELKEREMEERHAARETEIEARQLNAELELERTLEAEKRTVDARLRHMEGYVSGKGIYDTLPTPSSPTRTSPKMDANGALHLSMSQFPKREISTHAIQMLNQQRRLKKQLPQLHLGRINVLREQQALKLEKLQEKQATEWDVLMVEKEEAEDELRAKQEAEEATLQAEFAKRKERMEWRWKVAEEMERKRLQEERGVMYADMKKVNWGFDAWKGVLSD